jgi:hypothetical protein
MSYFFIKTIIFFDPLKQFDFFSPKTCLNNIFHNLTGNTIYLIFSLLIFFIIIYILNTFYDNTTGLIWQTIYFRVEGAVIAGLLRSGYSFYLIVFFLGVILYVFNTSGLIPYTYTLTSQLVLVLCLSFMVLIVL